MEELSIGSIISNAITIGLKNAASLVGAIVLWIITLWIPYLNIGTTIGMVGIIATMSKGKIFSPTDIFDTKYRKNFGEFFLLIAFIFIGINVASILFIIPGIILGIVWGQALLLFLDKNLSPFEALHRSNEITYGKKWTIFLGEFILSFIIIVVFCVIVAIFKNIAFIRGLFTFIGIIVCFSIMMGAKAYIYGTLSKTVQPKNAETPKEQ